MAILKINYDILTMIMSWAERQTLLVCCLVSKDYQSAALPFLYREVKLGWLPDYGPTPILTDLIGKPRLARHVRTLSTGLVDRREASLANLQSAGNTFDPLAALGAFANLRFLDLWVLGVVDIQPITDAIASLSQLHSLTICTDKSEFMDCLFIRLSLCRPLRHLVVHDHTGARDAIYLDSLVELLCCSSKTLCNWKPVMNNSNETALCAKLHAASVIWEQVRYLFCSNLTMTMAAMFPNIRALYADVSSELLEILAQPTLLPNLRTLHLSHRYYDQFTPAESIRRPVAKVEIGHGAILQPDLDEYASTGAHSVLRCMQLFHPSALRSIIWDSIYPEVLPIYAAALAQFSALEYLELYFLTQFDYLDYDENYIVEKEENFLNCLEVALQHLLSGSLPVSLRYILLRRRASSNHDLRVKPDTEHITSIGDRLCSSAAGAGRYPGLRVIQLHADSQYFTWRRPTGSPPAANSPPWMYLGDSSTTPAEPEAAEIGEWLDRQPDAGCFGH